MKRRRHNPLKGNLNGRRSLAERPMFGDIGPRPKTCQWIEADPRVDPTKCGALVAGPHTPYCVKHHRRAWIPRTSIRQGETPR